MIGKFETIFNVVVDMLTDGFGSKYDFVLYRIFVVWGIETQQTRL